MQRCRWFGVVGAVADTRALSRMWCYFVLIKAALARRPPLASDLNKVSFWPAAQSGIAAICR